jgi:nucleotide-binding universal stress UspA family protein
MPSPHGTDSARVRTILVPLDGSDFAEDAIPVAADLAKRWGATVEFATVEPPLSTAVMSYDSPDAVMLTQDDLQEELHQYVASKADAVRTTHGIHASERVLRGLPAPALARHIDAHKIDLVVMTTHGRGGLSRFWLGSVADQLLRRSKVPVLLLRPGSTTAPGQFHRVLVALDGSPQSETVLDPAATLAGMTPGSMVVLVRVIDPPLWTARPELEQAARRVAAHQLEGLAQRLRLRGTPVTVRVESGPTVAARILESADAVEADLIVVGTHGARGVERLVLGSVADKVVRGANRAVLVAPCGPVQQAPAVRPETSTAALSCAL